MATILRPLYRELASIVAAYKNCLKRGNTEWEQRHMERIQHIARNLLPSGSGIDSGTLVDIDSSHSAKLVLTCSFHHMNDNGMYTNWTDHVIVVTPAFDGIDVLVKGRNQNDIKEYLAETFGYALGVLVDINTTPLAVARDERNIPLMATSYQHS